MIRPRGSNILAVAKEVKDKTAGGLLIPATIQEDDMPELGIVKSAGDVEDLKEGDEIIFKRYASTIIELDRVKYMLIDNEDILGVVE